MHGRLSSPTRIKGYSTRLNPSKVSLRTTTAGTRRARTSQRLKHNYLRKRSRNSSSQPLRRLATQDRSNKAIPRIKIKWAASSHLSSPNPSKRNKITKPNRRRIPARKRISLWCLAKRFSSLQRHRACLISLKASGSSLRTNRILL